MDKNKIEELKNKRQKLQEELRLKNLRQSIASQIAHLDKLGYVYNVYYESENLNWIDQNIRVKKRNGYNGIHGDFQIDVDDSTTIINIDIKEEEINTNKFSKHFLALILDDNSLIVCYQGSIPELKISVSAFLSNPIEFFARPETWVITTDKKWIIEYIWEQNVIRFIQIENSIPSLMKTITIIQA